MRSDPPEYFSVENEAKQTSNNNFDNYQQYPIQPTMYNSFLPPGYIPNNVDTLNGIYPKIYPTPPNYQPPFIPSQSTTTNGLITPQPNDIFGTDGKPTTAGYVLKSNQQQNDRYPLPNGNF